MSDINIDVNGEQESVATLPEEQISEVENSVEQDTADAATSVAEDETDYDALIEEDLRSLRAEFQEAAELTSITELNNPLRYAALRDLGLCAREAYLATGGSRARRDTRAHLGTAYGRRASTPGGIMTQRELSEARELFGDLKDEEIQRLYRRVTK